MLARRARSLGKIVNSSCGVSRIFSPGSATSERLGHPALRAAAAGASRARPTSLPGSQFAGRRAASGYGHFAALAPDCGDRAVRCYPQSVIQNAIVPVAGFGTRLLPATKSQPKEMLPVARKPIVQYVAEELVNNGLKQILFITGRGKSSIENHFDHDPELIRMLEQTNKKELLEALDFSELKANYFYTRQPVQKGLGDAILCGESFAGQGPFVVALGDSIIGLHAQSKLISQMVGVFEKNHASAVVAVEEVPREEVKHYGIVEPASTDGEVIRVANLIEKPEVETAPSNLAIAARYVFSPLIFDLIKQVKPDKRGEIQLTNAIQMMCEEGRRVLAVKLPAHERRYDIGNFPSYFESFVEFALADPEYGEEFRATLKRLLGV